MLCYIQNQCVIIRDFLLKLYCCLKFYILYWFINSDCYCCLEYIYMIHLIDIRNKRWIWCNCYVFQKCLQRCQDKCFIMSCRHCRSYDKNMFMHTYDTCSTESAHIGHDIIMRFQNKKRFKYLLQLWNI